MLFAFHGNRKHLEPGKKFLVQPSQHRRNSDGFPNWPQFDFVPRSLLYLEKWQVPPFVYLNGCDGCHSTGWAVSAFWIDNKWSVKKTSNKANDTHLPLPTKVKIVVGIWPTSHLTTLADRWVLTSSGVSPVKGPFTWSQIRASDLFIGHFDSQIRRMSSRCRAFQSTFATNCALHESHRLKCKENRHNFPFFCVQCRHSSSGHSIGAKCTQNVQLAVVPPRSTST